MMAHKDNPYELLDIYDEIYRNTKEFWMPVKTAEKLVICPNCLDVVDILTSDFDPGLLLECPRCGYQCYIGDN